MKIAVVNTKGGVAKTTSAVYLAAAAAARGYTVDLVDLDPQGSSTAWLERAELPAGVSGVIGNHRTITQQREAQVTIFDTGPGDPGIIEAVLAVADFSVIPTKPGRDNTERTLYTAKWIERLGKDAAVLLADVDERERTVARATRAEIQAAALIFDTSIPHRTAINLANGSWPAAADLYGYDAVLAEVEDELKVSI